MYTPILVRTLKYFNKKNLPVTKEELFQFSIFKEEEKPLSYTLFEKALKTLKDKELVFEKDGYYSLDCKNLPINIREREIAERRYTQIKERYIKHAQKLKSKSIKTILLIQNQFLNSILTNPQESADIILITDPGKEHIAHLKLILYLKLKKIRYRNIYLLNINEVKIPKSMEWAHAISTSKILHNKGGFDKLISKNNWIFNLLKNYPLEKLNITYKVELKKEDKQEKIPLKLKIVNKVAHIISNKLS